MKVKSVKKIIEENGVDGKLMCIIDYYDKLDFDNIEEFKNYIISGNLFFKNIKNIENKLEFKEINNYYAVFNYYVE